MELGLYSNFYPGKDRLGTHSTSLALLLLRADPELRLQLAVPQGSQWPAGFARDRVDFRPSWRHDGPGGMARAAARLARSLPSDGHALFNWFPTCFGETKGANATGMLLPGLVRTLSRNAPSVYAHNFIETQDVRRLGYHATRIERFALRSLERTLVRSARVFVPLDSQRRSLERLFGISVTARSIPFVEALYGHWVHEAFPGRSFGDTIPPRQQFRVLLFGVWGPAKDLDSVLPVLDGLYRSGQRFETLFAGSFNRFFPGYRDKLRAALASLPAELCQFVNEPPDEATPELFGSSDLVILPYNAIAGPSGVMGLAAFHGCRIIAYDVPELREYDAILAGQSVFVARGDRTALAEAIARCMAGEAPGSQEPAASKVMRAEAAARQLLQDIARG
jgi:glycosyltransferase involved in cell wall biosynthesis